MNKIKKSILGLQCILLLFFTGIVYIAYAEEDISPQERFKQLQEKAETQRIEFEQAQKEERKRIEEKKKTLQERASEKKDDFRAEAQVSVNQPEAKRTETKEKTAERREEISKKKDLRKAILQERQQERIKNLAANVSNRMEAVITRLRQIIDRFQIRIDTLKERGVDITPAQTSLTEASTHLDEAQILISGIDRIIAEVIGSESPREAWANAKTRYIEIKNHIKLAHTALRTSLQLLKDAVSQSQNEEERPPTEIENPSNQEAPTN